MTVQNLTDRCLSLYCQGKYNDCFSELEPSKLDKLPALDRGQGYLLAAKIKRELTDFNAASGLLKKALEAAKECNDSYLLLEVELTLNMVLAKLSRNQDKIEQLVHESELLLNRVRQLKGNVRCNALHLTALCELGLTKLLIPEVELAAQNFRLASGLAEEAFGCDSAEMIFPELCLSLVHAMEGKDALSLAMARNASRNVRANFGKHPLLIQPLYRLAQAATRRKLFDLALDASRQVEGLIIDYIGEESDIYLDLLGIKTLAFMFKIEYQAAEKAASKRLKLTEKKYGRDDSKIIDPLCDLAQAVVCLGEKDRAEKYFDRALRLVSEFGRDQGFFVSEKDGQEKQIYTTGTRLEGASLCHLEYDLTQRLSDCYLWQGKLVDAAKLMPASARSSHICRVDNVVSIIEAIGKHLEERARNLQLSE